MRAWVYSNGGNPDLIPADDMRNMEMMFHDGIIGPKALLTGISALTTGNLNSKLKQGAKHLTIRDVLPLAHEYIIPPLTEEEKKEQANQQLLAMLSQMPEADKFLKV